MFHHQFTCQFMCQPHSCLKITIILYVVVIDIITIAAIMIRSSGKDQPFAIDLNDTTSTSNLFPCQYMTSFSIDFSSNCDQSTLNHSFSTATTRTIVRRYPFGKAHSFFFRQTIPSFHDSRESFYFSFYSYHLLTAFPKLTFSISWNTIGAAAILENYFSVIK